MVPTCLGGPGGEGPSPEQANSICQADASTQCSSLKSHYPSHLGFSGPSFPLWQVCIRPGKSHTRPTSRLQLT